MDHSQYRPTCIEAAAAAAAAALLSAAAAATQYKQVGNDFDRFIRLDRHV